MISFDEFITLYTNKPIDTDSSYGNQCMDLMHRYCVDVLSLDLKTLAASSAHLVYENFVNIVGHEKFNQIGNTPDGVPQKGDIVFFGATPASPYGHVCIFIDGNTNTFRSFDQNWPSEGYVDHNGNFIGTGTCHVQDHNYNGVLGWLRLKPSIVMIEIPTDTYTMLVTKASNLDKITNKLSIDSMDAISGDKVNEYINSLRSTINYREDRLKALDGQISIVQGEDVKDKQTIDDLTKQLVEKAKSVEELQMSLDVDSVKIEQELTDIEELKKQIKNYPTMDSQSMSALKVVADFISKFIKFT